jgi:hypothetical protein
MVSHAFKPRGDDLYSLSENGVQQLGEFVTETSATRREQQRSVQSVIQSPLSDCSKWDLSVVGKFWDLHRPRCLP